MSWPVWEEVQAGHPDLASDRLIPVRGDLLAEAVQTVKDDLSSRYKVDAFDTYGVPGQVSRLAVYKARDLGYVSYFGGEPPEGTSAPEWRRRYNELLDTVRTNPTGDLALLLVDPATQTVRVF